MKKIRLIYRLCFFLLCVCILLLFRGISRLTIKNKINRQKTTSSFVQFLSAKIMKAIGCSITTKGLEHLQKNQNYLIVANHVSYSDVTLLYSFIDKNQFISHLALKEGHPFLHLVVRAGGSYFIERRFFKHIRKELRDTSAILKQGLNLIFFPEGTSTDGSKIAPFHPLFFTTAIQAGKPILPICINYKKVEGMAWSMKNKDLISWHDDSGPFAQHLFRFLQLKSIAVELVFLPPIDSKGKNSRWLAEESRKQIQKHWTPPIA